MNRGRVQWAIVLAAAVSIAGIVVVITRPDPHRVRTAARPVATSPTTTRPAPEAGPTTTIVADASVGPDTSIPPPRPARPTARPVALAAPSPAPTPAPLPEVGIYGDSLTVMSWEHYSAVTAGEFASYEHARAATTITDWSAAIESDPLGRLVLALGTNDATRDGARPWAEVLNAIPATTCIVWPKPYEGSTAVTLFNAQMAAIVSAHPNVHVIDWDAEAKAHPEWVLPDGIHYTNEGFDNYAEMLRQAAGICP